VCGCGGACVVCSARSTRHNAVFCPARHALTALPAGVLQVAVLTRCLARVGGSA